MLMIKQGTGTLEFECLDILKVKVFRLNAELQWIKPEFGRMLVLLSGGSRTGGLLGSDL